MSKPIIIEPKYSVAEAFERFHGVQLTRAIARRERFKLVKGSNVEFRTSEGKLIARLVHDIFDDDEQAKRHALWNQVKDAPRNRPEIFSRGARQRLRRKDGTLTDFVGVPDSVTKKSQARTGMLGPFRSAKAVEGQPQCSLTSWTKQRPSLFRLAIEEAVVVTRYYEHLLPVEYARQLAYLNTVKSSWKLLHTAFTAIYGIANHPTAVHVDEFDIPEATGVITTSGNFTGNEFCLPRYGLAIDVQPCDLLFVDVHELHGNLPRISGERVGQVYFVRKDMHKCGEEAGAVMITAKNITEDTS